MGKYRNITDEALFVVASGGLVRVDPDGVVDLPDEQAQATAANGHPAPVWAPVTTSTTKKSASAAKSEE